MTKGKKWTLRLLGVAVLALLICLCLMGNTMARYTSQGTGNGTLTVALWDLEVTAKLASDESISPSEEEYGKGEGRVTGTSGARENASSWMVAFSIENNGDVDAYVDVAVQDGSIGFEWTTDSDNGAFSWLTLSGTTVTAGGWATNNGTNAYGQKLMAGFGTSDTNKFNSTDYYGEEAFKQVVNDNKIFSIKLAYADDSGTIEVSDDLKLSEVTGSENNGLGVKITAGDSLDFYAEVVWTSIYESGQCPTAAEVPEGVDIEGPAWTDWASYSDAVDTILGMYCGSITFGVSWTAVQASVQPDPNAETGAP